MRLRKQLLFLSLVTLALPWVGCQYIREMDATLRRGQTDALVATANAVSARLSSDPTLTRILTRYSNVANPLYAHSLKSPLFVDGYDDDWISQGLVAANLARNGSPPAKILLGIRDQTLYIFVRVKTSSIEYFRPSEPTLGNHDHLLIHTDRGKFAVFASAPGQLKAIRSGDAKRVSDKTTEHHIKGFWLEWEKGYQIEMSLPLAWVNQGAAFRVSMAKNPAPDGLYPQPLLTRSEALSQELEVFASTRLRLQLVTKNHYLIASSGSISLQTLESRRHGFLEWLYSFSVALGNREFTPLAGKHDQSATVSSALNGDASQSWYQLGTQNIAQASVPILNDDNHVIGAVVANQGEASLTKVTNDAFSRLLAYSFLASTFSAICLVVYATWLSLRIKSLSEAAAHAVSESGKVTGNFPISSSGDEIGELSRNYAQLLVRLREYTNYLRTLSSKLSHELRTPLAIVRSSLDNLEHEKLNQQAKVYADRAREGTTRLSNILNAMSAASRVEQAITAAEKEVIPCRELLESLKEAYGDVYKHVYFKLNIRQEPEGLNVAGSGELLVQALDKLVDNAADFCPKNGLIELGLYRHRDHVIFTVRNEGPPLPSHMHGQLFDSMVSVRDESPTAEGHHLGLGLHIVRLITDFHHGEVQGYNIPDNSGVIFEVRLPASE